VRLIDRVITRDATKIKPGQVVYTPWCDEHGKVIDDGTIARLDDDSFRWTSAEPHLRWFTLNGRGLDVEIADISEQTGAIALQGPLARAVLGAATGTDWDDLRFYHRGSARVGSIAVDVSRTGYTGDLGYELWFDAAQAGAVWDCLMQVGRPYALRPAGMLALDMARLEAGLILIEVDYTSSKHALIPAQNYSPFEMRPWPPGERRQVGGTSWGGAPWRPSSPPAVPRAASWAWPRTTSRSRRCTRRRTCRLP